jgi:putative ubiquitin-RnfH superfamily antitoxin RatB of RatAB toxin-antitoxin module
MAQIEIAYCLPEKQILIPLNIVFPSTVKSALLLSGFFDQFPHLDIDSVDLGIFGQRVTLETLLREHDRIEIYRPLQIDPKQARRLRAKKRK